MDVIYKMVYPNQLPAVLDYMPTTFLVISTTSVSPEWRFRLSQWMVEAGCHLMLAWGVDCSLWDDAVDEADIDFWDCEVPNEHLILTTWHDNESLDEVMFFAKHGLRHAHTPSERTILLHISDVAGEDHLLACYANA